MQIFFDHIASKQSDCTFNHTIVSAIFNPEEYDSAFETGWLPDTFWYTYSTDHTIRCQSPNEFVWTPSRSSRINIKDFEINKKQRRLFKNNVTASIVTNKESLDIESLYSIYRKYVEERNFKDYSSYSDFKTFYFREDFHYLLYSIEDKLSAFCIVQPIGSNLMSYQFCWDYLLPKYSLGTYSQIFEVEYAKKLNLKNVYIGPIAESINSYKSKFKGFEYFNGRVWVEKNNELFEHLNNDSMVTTISDLVSLQNTYLSNHYEQITIKV
jgi:arginyl-tRNA--protein-N-Asp/Glu arginylyltransferase